MESIGACSPRILSNGRGVVNVSVVTQQLSSWWLVSPRIDILCFGFVIPAGGFFPFGFGGQMPTDPLAVSDGIVPSDVGYWVQRPAFGKRRFFTANPCLHALGILAVSDFIFSNLILIQIHGVLWLLI